jgi:hypothetical protein
MPKHDRVYQVNKDGTAQIRDGEQVRAEDGDLGVVIGALVQMAQDLQQCYATVPDRTDALFNAGARQAFLTAGNALDYAFRLVDDIHTRQTIAYHRRELEAATKRFIEEPPKDPGPGHFPQPGVTLTEASQA